MERLLAAAAAIDGHRSRLYRTRLPDWAKYRHLGYFLKLLMAKNWTIAPIQRVFMLLFD